MPLLSLLLLTYGKPILGCKALIPWCGWLLCTCKMGLQGNQHPFALTIPTTKTFCSHRRLHYIGLVIFHPSCDQICGNFFLREIFSAMTHRVMTVFIDEYAVMTVNINFIKSHFRCPNLVCPF
jgi:hypothetical protein